MTQAAVPSCPTCGSPLRLITEAVAPRGAYRVGEARSPARPMPIFACADHGAWSMKPDGRLVPGPNDQPPAATRR
jgi:hypothetical protein